MARRWLDPTLSDTAAAKALLQHAQIRARNAALAGYDLAAYRRGMAAITRLVHAARHLDRPPGGGQ